MPIINLSDLDRKILAKHDPAVRARALLELEIVHKLIDTMSEYEYYFRIKGEPPIYSLTPLDDLIWQLFDLDDATLLVFNGPKKIGWIHLVFGNNGYDLISDYSTNLESLLKPVNEMAGFWG